MTELLDRITSPQDLKKLTIAELQKLASEIRDTLNATVSENGGHLASSLGAVEITIALHRMFNSPEDKIVWDVGHQAYPHKLITGRKDRFSTLRQINGLSGFPDRAESPHDAFGVGHAGTSISAAMGMALARDLTKKDYHVIAVIGDGSLGNGMALEAINHAGHLGTKLIVILNDNGIAISPTVGAISNILNRVRFDPRYETAKRKLGSAVTRMPLGKSVWSLSKIMKRRATRAMIPSSFWEELGFVYLGPVDGHNIVALEAALKRAKNYETRPTILHVITTKGKGNAQAEANATKFHGVSPKGNGVKSPPGYSKVFGDTLAQIMEQNEKVVAISAAMLDGTGLNIPAAKYSNRVFDVGICEEHGVTMAAGLATQGFVPVVAVYSTFLQRAYDQIILDVCMQNLPVVFGVDRAGIVGDDGKTHQGAFDISFMRSIPNLIVSAPKDTEELRHMLFTATNCGKPMSIRYPRGAGEGLLSSSELKRLPIGKGEVLREGEDVTIISIGASVIPTLAAAEKLTEKGVYCSVINARFAKPLDEQLILESARRTGRVVTVEENALAGGFGSAVLELLATEGVSRDRVKCIGLPDEFIEHGTQEIIRAKLGLDATGIAQTVEESFPELFIHGKMEKAKLV